ncbi:MAG TPA: hypothetical protein PLF26_16775, partial [Blastocatellia bacterium]|nr:hypothetical protein [Blastocatellia bacterium]
MSATRARRRGPDPMRGEILGVEGLEQLARTLAGMHRIGGKTVRVRSLPDRLEDNRATLTAMYRDAARAQRNGHPVSFAAEWILDNFHIVQEQLREGAEDLPRRYYRELPKLADGEYAGLPRVYAIAAAFVAHTDGHLELESLGRVVRAYQTVSPLTIGELWAIPIAMRLGLVENLARLAARDDQARQEVEAADQLVDELIAVAEQGADAVRTVMTTRVAKRISPSTTMFVAEMLQRLRDQEAALDPAVDWLERRLAEQETTVDDVLRRERTSQAANQVSVGNAITSMRTITATDWTEFFESVSPVDVVLRGDPAGAYERLDFATRDRYRHAVERIARRAPHDEPDVARLAVELADVAGQSDPNDVRRAHVGYYLVGDGVAVLEAAAGYKAMLRTRAARVLAKHPTLVYLGGIAAITAAVVTLALLYAARSGASPLELLVVALISLVPLSDLAISVVNYVVTLVVPPTVLPKLDLKDGIPADCKTFVVIPMLFSSVEDVDDTVGRLEIHYLANSDAELHFGILSDCRDSAEESPDSDRPIIDAAVRSIQTLNERYGADRFFLFHRRRIFNEADAVWMGWERKRGKLEEFNRLLRGDASTSYATVIGDTSVLPSVRYVITLDADTSLPSGAARELVGTIAHPLHRARLDESSRRIVEGYGILQPRVSVSLVGFSASRFSRIFSGYRGVDPYTTAVSDVYQDLFSEGSFIGKGIYDVDAFASALGDRVPENTLLSHDLFEGCYARAALVSDVELFDDHPSRYDVFTKRKHRWIRGDWQLVPWLFPTTPTASGRRPNVLPIIARWKILDNLRRSLVGPSALLLLVAGWAALPGSPLVWTALTIVVLAFPVYAHLLTAAMNTPGRAMFASYYR